MKTNTPLQTDLYQLTMGYGYWQSGMHEREAVFHLYYRTAPFSDKCVIAAGLEQALTWIDEFSFDEDELGYLSTLLGNDGQPLFEKTYLQYLQKMKLSCDVWAVPEGELVYPNEPIMRIQGPLIQCQLLETALLNIINFQTLIATQSARICEAAQGDPVLEFGLRRAQGPDGGLSASRASYIGGCVGTSNVEAGYRYGIPVKGTHAHSWVMSFDSEMKAFEAYADAMPNNCVLLVDTYGTESGVENAIEVGKRLRENGHELQGVRLDSGDLLELSILARRRLDEEGFSEVDIVASNDLSVESITHLKKNGAMINVWGVGTKLVTAFEQPALGGVYKLAGLQNTAGDWEWKVKRSDDLVKVSLPGMMQVFRDAEKDVIKHSPNEDSGLLECVVRNGSRCGSGEEILQIRERAVKKWLNRSQDREVVIDPELRAMQLSCLER